MRLFRSVGFAVAGIRYIAATEPNWRIDVVCGAAAIILGLVLQLTPAELAILALTIGFVLAAEAANTALEDAIDAVGVYSEHAKHAKDAAAGAVLVAAITSVVVGVVLFGPRVLALLWTR